MEKADFVSFIGRVLPMEQKMAEEIAAFFHEETIGRGTMLLKEKQIADRYFFLLDGFARSYTYDSDGNDITTGFYSAGQVMCDLDSFFKRTPSRENYLVLSDIRAYAIDFDRVQVAFHSVPYFREWGRAMLVNAYAALKDRMLSALRVPADQRYLHLLRSNPAIFQHAALKDVASYLGITDTSLSRIRKELAGK
jgi:CRP-like cAMP-binding protein